MGEKRIDLGLTALDELFMTEEGRQENRLPRIRQIPLDMIDDMPDHPFKVRRDDDMELLIESVREHGVITPIIVRQKEDGRYETAAGHRRRMASKINGLTTVPAEVRDMTRDEAIILMVESNLQRSTILPNAEGKISDDRLSRVVADLEKEASVLEAKIAELDVEDPAEEIQENYERFFALAKQYTYIETLDRDTLVTFIDRIEIGEKILPEGYVKMPRKNASYQQSIRIFYKFIGEIVAEPVREFAPGSQNPVGTPLSGEFNM